MSPSLEQSQILFDSDCRLCNFGVHPLGATLPTTFEFYPLRSPRGQELLKQYGFPADYQDSLVVIHQGQAYCFGAALRLLAGFYRGGWLLGLLPLKGLDLAYQLVARGRYYLGRSSSCPLPKGGE